MTDPAERLKAMRKAAGYPSARAAARAMGVPVPTYVQHESAARAISIRQFERYRIFLQTARLVVRFLKTTEAVPEPEVLAALVYDALHTAKHWADAPLQTMETYRKGVQAVLLAKGITLPADPASPVLELPEGSQ